MHNPYYFPTFLNSLTVHPIFKCSSDFTDKRQLFNFIPTLQRSAVNLENITCMHVNPLLVISSNAHQKVICLKVICICILISFFSWEAFLFPSLLMVSHISFIASLNSWQNVCNSTHELQALDLCRQNFNIKVTIFWAGINRVTLRKMVHLGCKIVFHFPAEC